MTWKELSVTDDLQLLPGKQYAALVSLSKEVSLDKLKEMAKEKGITGNAWQEGDKVPIAIPPDTEDNHRHVYIQGKYAGNKETTVPRKAPWPFTLFYVRKFWILDESPGLQPLPIQGDFVEKPSINFVLVIGSLLLGALLLMRKKEES